MKGRRRRCAEEVSSEHLQWQSQRIKDKMENFCLFLSGQDNWLAEKLIPICVFVYRDTKSLDVFFTCSVGLARLGRCSRWKSNLSSFAWVGLNTKDKFAVSCKISTSGRFPYRPEFFASTLTKISFDLIFYNFYCLTFIETLISISQLFRTGSVSRVY